ncbi:hypothetical protein HK405_010160 [Cladochytrium tenue]|nr:hypothetical protein HK405_010160 [Cladochytrium tenue]
MTGVAYGADAGAMWVDDDELAVGGVGGPAVMTLAPCTRVTEEVIADAIKKGIPGPGAYDPRPAGGVAPRRKPGARVPAFGGSGNHHDAAALAAVGPAAAADRARAPGPGAYYPELSGPRRPAAARPQPFGSSAVRFDPAADGRVAALPAPGSYDVAAPLAAAAAAAASAAGRFGRQAMAKSTAFGSVSRRFDYSQTIRAAANPGPGHYEVAANSSVAAAMPVPAAAAVDSRGAGGASTRGLQKRMRGPVAGGTGIGAAAPATAAASTAAGGALGPLVAGIGVGSGDAGIGGPRTPSKDGTEAAAEAMGIDSLKLRVAAFGSQTDRFADLYGVAELPPPGSYDVAGAFAALRTKGRVDPHSFLRSKVRRELFKVPTEVPGPGDYNVQVAGRTSPEAAAPLRGGGGFLSTMKRFQDKPDTVPGPGAYLAEEPGGPAGSLVRPTFNVTLGPQREPAGWQRRVRSETGPGIAVPAVPVPV